MADEFINAAENGDIQRIRDLLDSGIDPNIQDENEFIALMEASSSGHIEIVELLLDRGADLHIQNIYGNTSLMYASIKGHTEIAKLLLDKGANLHIKDGGGRTALMLASIFGHIEITKLLLNRGANLNIYDNRRRTALTFAINYGHTEIVQFIQDHIALQRVQQNLAFAKYLMDNYDLDQDVASRLFEIPRDYDPKINIRMLDEARRDRLTKSRQRLASMRSMHSREGPFGSIRYDPSIMENISRHLSRIGPVPSVQERLMLEDRQTGSGRRRRIKQRKQRKNYTRNRF